MARLTILQALEEREWQYKEGFKVYCPTCGIEHRDSTKVKTHRKGCEYLLLTKRLYTFPELANLSQDDLV